MIRLSYTAFAVTLTLLTAFAPLASAQILSEPNAGDTSPKASNNDRWLHINDCLLEAEKHIAVPAQETGLLKSLNVKLNQSVVAGEELAKLDSSDSESELKSRKQDYRFALDLANDDSDIDFHRNSLRVAEEDLANYKKIAQSVSDFEIVRRELARDGAKLAVRRAEKVKERATVDAARIGIAVEAALHKLNRSRVIAPATGIISEVLVRPGEWVQVGEPLLRLSDMERLVVHAHVNVDQIDRSQIIGALVRVDSTTDLGAKISLNGKITSYDHGISRGGMIRIHAQVENEMVDGHWRLLPGKQVTLHVVVTTGSASGSARDESDTSTAVQ